MISHQYSNPTLTLLDEAPFHLHVMRTLPGQLFLSPPMEFLTPDLDVVRRWLRDNRFELTLHSPTTPLIITDTYTHSDSPVRVHLTNSLHLALKIQEILLQSAAVATLSRHQSTLTWNIMRELALEKWDESEAHARATLTPHTLVASESLREIGWVIEREDSEPCTPRYWAGFERPLINTSLWSPNHMEAFRFSRQEDATRMADSLKIGTRICEHIWG